MKGRRLPYLGVGLAAYLVLWEPLTFAATASAALSRIVLYGLPAYLLLGLCTVVVGFGIAAGRSLWTLGASGPRLVLCWAAGHAAATTLTFATPYFPSNRVPGTKGWILASRLLVDLSIALYAWQSGRLRRALDQ